jgi:hypothetical protein
MSQAWKCVVFLWESRPELPAWERVAEGNEVERSLGLAQPDFVNFSASFADKGRDCNCARETGQFSRNAAGVRAGDGAA